MKKKTYNKIYSKTFVAIIVISLNGFTWYILDIHGFNRPKIREFLKFSES